jgi:hypothetical protein
MVLRRTSSGTFKVVGECYVHGLGDAVGILGSLPDHWRTIIKGDALGRPTQHFLNIKNGEETVNDPRLGPLPAEWERVTSERLAEDPATFERFRNLETGAVLNSDPRWFPDALLARGIQLGSFSLA